MSASRRQVKVSRNQQELIIAYLNEHESFKTRQFTSTFTKEDYNTMWDELAKMLNSDGTGPHKTVDKWKNMLADWKSNTKLKNATIIKSRNGTGGGEKTTDTLTDIEERLLAVWGKELTDGIAQTQEFGLPIDPKSRIIEKETTESSFVESEISQKVGDGQNESNKNSDSYLGLEDYEIDENYEPTENEPLPEEIEPVITSNAEKKRRLEKDAKKSLEKRQALMNEGKTKPRNEFEKASILIEKVQNSQNNIIGEISSSLMNMVKETRNIFEQQTEMAVQQTEIAVQQTEMAVQQTEIAVQQTEMAVQQTEMAVQQTEIAVQQTEMAVQQTEMAVQLKEIISQQNELISLKTKSNQIKMLKLAAQRKNNDIMQSLLNVLVEKNTR